MTDLSARNAAIVKMMEEQTAELIADPVKLAAWAENQRREYAEYQAYMDLERHEGNCHCARCMSEFFDRAPDPVQIARSLPPAVRRAVLMAPFNSKGSGFRGGTLAAWNKGNGHMGNKPALFIRAHSGSDYSGDYSLTPLGHAVRLELEKTTPGDPQ